LFCFALKRKKFEAKPAYPIGAPVCGAPKLLLPNAAGWRHQGEVREEQAECQGVQGQEEAEVSQFRLSNRRSELNFYL
jgi:hypothetical protein